MNGLRIIVDKKYIGGYNKKIFGDRYAYVLHEIRKLYPNRNNISKVCALL